LIALPHLRTPKSKEQNHREHGEDTERSQSGKREKKERNHEEHGVKEKRARSEKEQDETTPSTERIWSDHRG
jgi:hypothetical protein